MTASPGRQRREGFSGRNLRGLESFVAVGISAPTTRLPQIAYFVIQKSFTALPVGASTSTSSPRNAFPGSNSVPRSSHGFLVISLVVARVGSQLVSISVPAKKSDQIRDTQVICPSSVRYL